MSNILITLHDDRLYYMFRMFRRNGTNNGMVYIIFIFCVLCV